MRNDDELHDDEQVYILRTKGLNAGTDWWPEIQLARIVLKPNQVESPYLVGLNAPIETVREEVVRELEAVSEEEKVPEPPPGCVRDLDPSKKEHRRVTFSGEKDPELKTDWKVETEQTCPEPPETCPDGSQTCQCPEPNQKLYINDIVDPKYFKCPDPEKPAAIEDDKPSDREWHDTIPMPPNETVFLIMSFDDKEQLGRFVFHCHILKHEDKGLMAPIEVWDTGDLKTKEASTPGR